MLVRKRPCPCGSGRPARHCCGRFRRLKDEEVASAFLGRQARKARDLIGPFSPAALDALRREAASLPTRCDTFTDALLTAGDEVAAVVERIGRAVARVQGRPAKERAGILESVVRRGDSPLARVAVAKAIIALREAGTVDEHLAAAVLVSLPNGVSLLTEAALLEAGVVVAGVESRPAHLESGEVPGPPVSTISAAEAAPAWPTTRATA